MHRNLPTPVYELGSDIASDHYIQRLSVIIHVVILCLCQFNCCGATGPSDYRHSNWYNKTRHLEVFVPTSCCIITPSSSSLSGGRQLALPTLSTALTPTIDDNQCQLHAVLFQTQKDSPSSSSAAVGTGTPLKTQVSVRFDYCKWSVLRFWNICQLNDQHSVSEISVRINALKLQFQFNWEHVYYLSFDS